MLKLSYNLNSYQEGGGFRQLPSSRVDLFSDLARTGFVSSSCSLSDKKARACYIASCQCRPTIVKSRPLFKGIPQKKEIYIPLIT